MTVVQKQGASFSMVGVLDAVGPSGSIPDLTGWVGHADLCQRDGTLIEHLVFTWISASSRIAQISASGSTNAWPIGVAYMDIHVMSADGLIRLLSSTGEVSIVQSYTKVA